MPKILAFAGSLRADSYNKRILHIAAKGASDAGAEVTILDLKDYPMPIFDEDVEKQGAPDNVRKVKELFLSHDAMIIASPEYNGSFTALLKNTIDWVSRPAPGERPLAGFAGKVVGIMSASTGPVGGLRSLAALRAVLSHIQMIVLPEQSVIPNAADAFSDQFRLKDERRHQNLLALGAKVASVATRLSEHER